MIIILKILIYLLAVIVLSAYMSLFERKLIGRIQKRYGPDQLGMFGIFQPIADALKLLLKRQALVGHNAVSIFAVCLFLIASLFQISIFPSSFGIIESRYFLLIIIVIHSIMAFSEVLMGISSSSKYGILGGTRAYIQTVASHIPYVLSILLIAISQKSFVLRDSLFVSLPFYVAIPFVFIFFVICLMNFSKIPFDFVESESELIAGVHTEYGGILFAMIYLSEYLNLMFIGLLISSIIFGIQNTLLLIFGAILTITLVILIRAMLPRYKQDQMIQLAWKGVIPILVVFILLI